jgi:DNA polymerase-3 subunit gamma/tau
MDVTMSDNYRALTRTYRPRTFDDIVSQEHVSSTLKNAIKQNRLAHAYMFCGPRGVGKTTMARVLARTVNSIEDQIDGESLNQTLNVIEIDAASNNGVDDIRDLRERVRIPPQNGRYKIYIIDEVHMLSKAAFNALLKTLEEPPDHVIFIFATTEPHKVLPTILSRVQRFDFKRISVEEIVRQLEKVAHSEAINIDNESLHVIAKKADGALRDALGLMDQAIAFCGTDINHEELLRALNVVSTERMFQFMKTVEKHDPGAGLELINELLQEGYDIQEFLIGLTEHLRNLYVAHHSPKMHLVEASEDTKKRYQQAAQAFSPDDLMRMLHIVSEAQYKIKEAHQPKIQFEITLLKLINMERTQSLNKLLAELEDLKKKLRNQPSLTSEHASAASSNGASVQADIVEENGASEPSGSDSSHDELQTASAGSTSDAKQANPDQTTRQVKPEAARETAVAEAESDDNDSEQSGGELDELFGRPSLAGPGTSPTMSNGRAASPNGQQETRCSAEAKAPPKSFSLAELKDIWASYVESLREHVPQMLYFQMQRIDPVKLKNRELMLRCNDDFAKKIVEENKRKLGKILERKTGLYLNMTCVVQKNKEDIEESMSPYERFKKLQERDPKIKTLVELFGAELDYNLSQ